MESLRVLYILVCMQVASTPYAQYLQSTAFRILS